MLPYYPYGGGTAAHQYPYRSGSFWHHLVSDYTGLNLCEVLELPYLRYLAWRRDAYIHRLEQSEQGREYLANAWRMEQTEPDRKGLKARAGHKEVSADNGK